MRTEIYTTIETSEKQILLFRELKTELAASRAAYLARDLEAIYAHLAAQAMLCEKLQQVEAESALRVPALPAGPRLPLGADKAHEPIEALDRERESRARKVFAELECVRREVCESNCAQIVFVKGSLRTLRVMTNALANLYPTYGRPDCSSFPAVPGVRP
jgi:hypothetical protein